MNFKSNSAPRTLLLVLVSSFVTWYICRNLYHDPKGADHKLDRRTSLQPNVDGARGAPSEDHRQTERSIASHGDSLYQDIQRRNMSPEMSLTYDFEKAADVAEANGDFSLLKKFFDGLSQAKREELFRSVPAVFSKLGPAHDIREKIAILEMINADSTDLENMRRSIYEHEAVERFEEMKKEGVLKTLSDTEFAAACRRLASVRIPYAFEAAGAAESETARREAAAAVAYSAMAGGTIAGSNAIAALPPGIVRDEAVAEMVIWLKGTGSEKEAAPWLDTIQDKRARARASGKQ